MIPWDDYFVELLLKIRLIRDRSLIQPQLWPHNLWLDSLSFIITIVSMQCFNP